MIELRWLALTKEHRPFVLQYRHEEPADYTGGTQWSEWKEVPFVKEDYVYNSRTKGYVTVLETLEESKKLYG